MADSIVVSLDCFGDVELLGGGNHIETPHLEGRSVGSSALMGMQQKGAAARNGVIWERQTVRHTEMGLCWNRVGGGGCRLREGRGTQTCC